MMKNKVNKKRGVKFLQGRAREGRGKSLNLLEVRERQYLFKTPKS